MKLLKIISLLDATCFTEQSALDLNHEIDCAFSCDLMSDVLAYVNQDILLITGLTHIQTLRTAEMLDIKFILFIRGKQPSDEMIDLANQEQITLLGTHLTMYEVSGLLYQYGLKGLTI